jgi:hypothetical protein
MAASCVLFQEAHVFHDSELFTEAKQHNMDELR